MKYRILFLETAYDDLGEIRAYLEQFSESAPAHVLGDILARIDELQTAPKLYPEYPRNRRYRKMIAGDYLVFYKVFEDEQLAEIHRVLHAARDIGAVLKKEK